MAFAPELRLTALNDRPVRADRDFVLYWMVANRRVTDNFALDHAIAHARRLGLGLLVLEPLRVGYRWASHRHHRFVIQGMAEHAADLADAPARYLPYVEPTAGAGAGLLEALAARAAVVVTDDYPVFFLPRMQAAAASRLDVRMEAVDSNGLYPMRATERVFARAVDFRRHLQKTLTPFLIEMPEADPFAGVELPEVDVPAEVAERWPAATQDMLQAGPEALASLPIDASVGPVDFDGGARPAIARWSRFLDTDLAAYADGRNHPDDDVSSRLSPWLHFGHIGVHRMFRDLIDKEGWDPSRLAPKATGSREGWWGMSPAAESFLDEAITWRELGWNMTSHRPDYDRLEALPEWALKTIAEHANDPRTHVYDLATFEAAQTHDDIWNAAQTQLVRTGRMHNYLRMLWGKMIYAWSPDARTALDVMEHLNNKYAVDGRDPNSYSGIFWVLGRYDRAWGPEREVFGKLRYMTSDSTRRKLHVKQYLKTYGAQPSLL